MAVVKPKLEVVGVNASTMRVDAAASVSRIIEAAKRVFAAGDGSGTLNRIAKEACVGIATLYRHFPNRETLAMAVYQQVFIRDIQPIFEEFERTNTPREVLLELGERLLGVLDRERGLAVSLGNVAGATHVLVSANIAALVPAVARAQEAGNLREDIVAEDIPNLLTMIAAGFGSIPSGPQRRRYLSLLLDSLNPAAAQRLPSV